MLCRPVAKVIKMGAIEGNSTLKASRIINKPRNPIEVRAPFFRYLYLAIVSIPFMVNSLTTKAPIPIPIKMRKRFMVKAKAPMTPSKLKVVSRTSR